MGQRNFLFDSNFGDGYRKSVRRSGIRHRSFARNMMLRLADNAKSKLEFVKASVAADILPGKGGRFFMPLKNMSPFAWRSRCRATTR
jgi:hypothetical protein